MHSPLKTVLFADGTSLKIGYDHEGLVVETFDADDQQTGLLVQPYLWLVDLARGKHD